MDDPQNEMHLGISGISPDTGNESEKYDSDSKDGRSRFEYDEDDESHQNNETLSSLLSPQALGEQHAENVTALIALNTAGPGSINDREGRLLTFLERPTSPPAAAGETTVLLAESLLLEEIQRQLRSSEDYETDPNFAASVFKTIAMRGALAALQSGFQVNKRRSRDSVIGLETSCSDQEPAHASLAGPDETDNSTRGSASDTGTSDSESVERTPMSQFPRRRSQVRPKSRRAWPVMPGTYSTHDSSDSDIHDNKPFNGGSTGVSTMNAGGKKPSAELDLYDEGPTRFPVQTAVALAATALTSWGVSKLLEYLKDVGDGTGDDE
jgi:hypothetical protein